MRNLTAKAFWILFSDGGAKLFGFFTTIYLARTFGAELYGLIVLAISVMSICIWFSDLGIQTLATRAMAAAKSENRTPAQYFWLKVTLSVAVIIISGIAIWFVLGQNPVLRNLSLLFLMSLLPQSLQIQWYYNGIQEFKWITLSNWIQGAVYLGGLIAIVSSDDLYMVPVIYSLSLLAGAITMLLVYRGNQSLLTLPDVSKWSDDIKNSFYLGSGHFMAQSIILMPPIIIGYFFSESDVGFYSVAFKLILVVMLADKMISTLLLANLSKLWTERPEDVPEQLRIVARWMIFFGSVGSIGLYFISPLVIPFLFGEGYNSSITMLKILCFFLPLTFLNSVYSYGLISFGKDRLYMKSTLIGGSSAVVLMVLGGLTNILSAMIVSVILAELLITISVYVEFKKVISLNIGSFTILLFSILAIAITLGSYISIATIPVMILVIGSFSLLLYVSGLIKAEDVNWLKRRITQ
ncbi:MAG TPA: oligosaccharide flippase family protein [Balneolaceae bacterium]|nr:oligosaccharide flippase family protein [Balneolaceae bacterium]